MQPYSAHDMGGPQLQPFFDKTFSLLDFEIID
jgi:hypothetical protein